MQQQCDSSPLDYAYADLILRTNLELPELSRDVRQAEGAPASVDSTIAIEIDYGIVQHEADRSWIQSWLDSDERPWLLLARSGDAYLLRFPGVADFRIERTGIRISAVQGAAMDMLRHQLLDQVLPRFMAFSGRLVLHASAVRIPDGRAILFLGASGGGKSTLAAGIAMHCGGQVLADDCVVVEQEAGDVRAIPSYAGLRLWNDSLMAMFPEGTVSTVPVSELSEKQRLAMTEAHPVKSASVSAIFALEEWSDTADVWIEPLTGQVPCQTLLRNSFQLDTNERSNGLALVARAAETARRIPMHALDYPRRYDWLPRAAAAILAHVAATPERLPAPVSGQSILES